MLTGESSTPARSADTSGSHPIAWLLIGTGLLLFPVLWSFIVIGRATEVRPLMRFLARSDAHVFFDLPGVFANLRAFSILFTIVPAAGATLVGIGVASRRGRSPVSAMLIGVAVGLGALLVAWAVVAWLVGP